MTESSPKARPPAARVWGALLIGWLIPGASFLLFGRWRRGLIHFATISLTFAIGLTLHSAVVWPTWSIRSEEFNLINNFTFIIQMGGGLPALASFLASQSTGGGSALHGLFAGIPHHPYYELGSYFLIVAGALNYFALGNFHDRIVNVQPRFVDQEEAPEAEPAS